MIRVAYFILGGHRCQGRGGKVERAWAPAAPVQLCWASYPNGFEVLIHKDGCDFCTSCGYIGACG